MSPRNPLILLPAYLSTLPVGEHTLTAAFNDGQEAAVSAVFVIKAKDNGDSADKDKKTDPAKPTPSPSSKSGTGTAAERKATPKTSDIFHRE